MFDPRQTNRRHWLIAQDFITILFNLFGAPQEIAARHTLVREQWRLIAKWLRAGEALMRQLLLIEAAALPKPNTRPLLWKRRVRKRRVMGFGADAPEAWRVSFRCFVSTFPGRSAKREEPGPMVGHAAADEWTPARRVLAHAGPGNVRSDPQRFHSAWPLAERAEALLRVFNDPAPYAKRLAARLYATPHRAAALTRHPPNLPHVIGDDDFAQLRENVATARRRFESG